MKNRKKGYINQRVITVFMVLSIVSIAFLSYKDILNYFFTGGDSLTLIHTSRIQSFADVVRIFTEPLMNSTAFVELARYYRPITALSYSLDYSLWKLNPFGYHLTDLILHIFVSVLVFFFIRFITNGKQAMAWLCAIIFTTHPILMESVPAISRRQDVIAALFILLSLLLFVKNFSRVSSKKWLLVLSVFFYILALGAKEIAIILPCLVFIYLISFSLSGENYFKFFKVKVILSAKECLPYIVVTFIFLAWRTYILQGIGGRMIRSNEMAEIVRVFGYYYMDLLYPDFLSSLFNPFPGTLEQIGSMIALSCFFIFLLFFRRALYKVNYNKGRWMNFFEVLLPTIVIFLLAGILSYPLLSPLINNFIGQAYLGEGPRFITGAMKGLVVSVEHYVYEARDIYFGVTILLLIFSVICLVGIHQLEKIERFFKRSDSGKLMVFSLIWLFLPFSIYLLTLTFSHRVMYISVIPFSAILSIMIVETFQYASRVVREYHFSGFSCRTSSNESVFVSFAVLIMAGGLWISLLAHSPFVRTYGGWEDRGKISSKLLNRLSEIAAESPNGAVINIYNLPNRICSYKSRVLHAKTVSCLSSYGIKSWLDLNNPNNEIDVVVQSKARLVGCPSNLDLREQLISEGTGRIHEYKFLFVDRYNSP